MFDAMLGTVLAVFATQTPSMIDSLLEEQRDAYAFARPNPGIHFSPSAAARYAMEQGCLPHVMTGRPAGEFFETAAMSRGPQIEGQYTVTTAVALKEEGNGACTIVVRRGDPQGLRAEMLAVLATAGATSEIKSDTGPGSRDTNGDYRQELHCLILDGKPLFLLMSSSSARNRPRLMASLGADPDGDCRRRRGA